MFPGDASGDIITTGTYSRTRVIVAGLIGNTLEWYDFSIYGYFASSIGAAFFPRSDHTAQILAAFGIFAVGYVMRPLGGTVMGYIGDRFGRKTALTISIGAMVIPTFLVGILPGYATLGLAAPVILTLLRALQGISVGGEFATSMVFLVEQAPANRRGLIGATAGSGASLGTLLGSGIGALLSDLLPPEAMADWGWRIPFLLGLLIGGTGVLVRRQIHETPPTLGQRTTLPQVLRRHPLLLLRFAGMACFFAVGFYLMFLFVVSWLQSVDGIPPARALEINTGAMTALIPAGLFMGWLSDRIGRKRLLAASMILGLVGSLPLLWLMHHPDPLPVLIGELGFVLIVGVMSGVIPAALAEAAPADARCTTVALGHNLAMGVIGGLTPLAAEWLMHRTANDLSPAYMLMAAAAISLFATFFQRETYRDPLAAAVAA